jgi:hypothetical protein
MIEKKSFHQQFHPPFNSKRRRQLVMFWANLPIYRLPIKDDFLKACDICIQKLSQCPCFLCQRSLATGIGVWLPSDELIPVIGDPPNKVRILIYSFCHPCHAIYGGLFNTRVESMMMRTCLIKHLLLMIGVNDLRMSKPGETEGNCPL